MLTRIREPNDDGHFVVTVYTAAETLEIRETDDLAEAFAMQKAVQDTGKWPDGKEPGK